MAANQKHVFGMACYKDFIDSGAKIFIDNIISNQEKINENKKLLLKLAIQNLAFNVINYLESKINYTDQDYQDIVQDIQKFQNGCIIPSDKPIETNKDWIEHYEKFGNTIPWLYNRTVVDRGYKYGWDGGYVASIVKPLKSDYGSTYAIMSVDPIDIVPINRYGEIDGSSDGNEVPAHISGRAGFQAQWFNENCQRMVDHLNIRLRRLGQLEISDNYRLTPLPNPFAFYQPQNPNQGEQVVYAPISNLHSHQ